MELVNETALDRAIRRHRETAGWLSLWAGVARAAKWRSLTDVRKIYPSSDGVRLASDVVVTVFNVKGNSYRLLTVINYDAQRIYIIDVLTHADYDKQKWKHQL